jgi:hypothetical protein
MNPFISAPRAESPTCPHGYHDCTTCRGVISRTLLAFPFSLTDFRIGVTIVSKRRLSMRVEENVLGVVTVGVYEYPWVIEAGRAEEAWATMVRNVRYRIAATMAEIDESVQAYERRKRIAARAKPLVPATPEVESDIEF